MVPAIGTLEALDVATARSFVWPLLTPDRAPVPSCLYSETEIELSGTWTIQIGLGLGKRFADAVRLKSSVPIALMYGYV